MARFDVERIVSGKRLPDGRRIDFTIFGDPDGQGMRPFDYTWDPDESGWPMADNITALFLADESIVVPDHVFEPPSKEYLRSVMFGKLRRLKVDDYISRKAITGEDIPADVLAKREAILSTYNSWHENPSSIPEDWDADSYWGAP